METLVMITAKTEQGYCCTCDLLSGWVVATERAFATFKKKDSDSVDFYLRSAKAEGTYYPALLDGEFEIEYSFHN